jgi:hypothetical protein
MQNGAKPTALELAVALAETLQAIVSRRHPDKSKTRNGRPSGGIRAAARELGVHETKAQRAMKIAAIPDDIKRAAIEAGLANNQKALLAVAKETAQTAKLAMVERLRPLPEPRADIPASIVLAREAFLAGQKDTYLGLTRDEWDRAADEPRWMVGLD